MTGSTPIPFPREASGSVCERLGVGAFALDREAAPRRSVAWGWTVGWHCVIALSLALAAWLIPVAATADAVVRSALESGNPGAPGSTFKILVQVAENDTGSTPCAFAFRVQYPANAVQFKTVESGVLGTVIVGAPDGGYPIQSLDFASMSNISNTNPTPVCCRLVFEVVDNPTLPYAITVEDQPRSSGPLLATDLHTRIPHSFDNSALSVLPLPTPTPTATETPQPSPTPPPQAECNLVDLVLLGNLTDTPGQDRNEDGVVDVADRIYCQVAESEH